MSDDGETVTIKKLGATQPVSKEMLSDGWGKLLSVVMGFEPDPRTPEQIAADRAAWAAETERLRREVAAEHEVVLAGAAGLRRAVLEFHGPVFRDGYRGAHCDGCDANGYEVEDTEFPCRTYVLACDYGETE